MNNFIHFRMFWPTWENSWSFY